MFILNLEFLALFLQLYQVSPKLQPVFYNATFLLEFDSSQKDFSVVQNLLYFVKVMP